MNLETLDLLTEKVEKALSTIRNLREQNESLRNRIVALELESQVLKDQIRQSEEALMQKDQDLHRSKEEFEERSIELNLLQETLLDRESKIQVAASRLEQVMGALESELNLHIEEQPEEEFDPENVDVSEEGYEPQPLDSDLESDSESEYHEAGPDLFQGHHP